MPITREDLRAYKAEREAQKAILADAKSEGLAEIEQRVEAFRAEQVGALNARIGAQERDIDTEITLLNRLLEKEEQL